MNKLILITIAIFTLNVNAQNKQEHKKAFLKDLSAEQIANLKTKKLTLVLDLLQTQQDKIYNLNIDLAKKRKAKIKDFANRNNEKKLTANQKYERQMKRLDNQIAYKKEMKAILNKDQYEKWQKIQMHRKGKKRKKRKK